ncbi:hypothetical protein HN615_13625 [Candidatus Woesearchaeota archaeon]|jgi:hypothetical protein|nr:hypothetical protein [bacterium]MBT7557940.1 hypothetical protein [Candidatus Woesearchaeota archaeon]
MKPIAKVDSTKLSIPLRNIELTNSDLIDKISHLKTNTKTGEIVDEHTTKGTPYIKKANGMHYRFWMVNQFTYNNGNKIVEPYITMLCNSKHIKSRYLDGITLDTLNILYDEYMSLDVFKCSQNEFKSARHTDTDIAIDYKMYKKQFASIKEAIKRNCIDSTKWHTLSKKNNSGIWSPTQNKPRDMGTPKYPYVKFYDKEIELLNNSKEFYDEYLRDVNIDNLVRFETTIKNSAHRRHLGIPPTTFVEFLSLNLEEIAKSIFRTYFITHKPMSIPDHLAPSEKVEAEMVNLLIKLGISSQKIYSIYDRRDVSHQSRDSLLKRHKKIMSKEQFDAEKLEANDYAFEFFKEMGVDLT